MLKASGSELEKIRAEQKSLEEQVKHYQAVLADTVSWHFIITFVGLTFVFANYFCLPFK